MKKMLYKAISWYKSSLLPQFLSLTVVTSVLFILAAQLVTSSYFDMSFRQVIDVVESDTMLMQVQNIERQLHEYINDVYRIVIDRQLYRTAKELQNVPPTERATRRMELRQMIADYMDNGIVYVTVVLHDKQVVFYSRLYGTWVGLPWFGNQLKGPGYDDELYALYDATLANQAITAWYKPGFYEPSETYLLHLAYPMIDLYTRDACGVLVVTFNTSIIRAMVNPTRNDDEFFAASYNILTAQDGTILAHPDVKQIGKTLCLTPTSEQDKIKELVYLSNDDSVISKPIQRLGLQLYSVTNKGIIARQARTYTSRLLMVIAVITLVQLLILYFMMRRMMRSVFALKKGLATVQGGQLDVYVSTSEQHEVAQSIHAFNAMARQLKLAEERSRQHAERTIAALERQRVAEIKTLENQINSHFLYNTLNSINYTAIRSGNLDVSRQIKHLAYVLRYTFEKSNGAVTTLEEARWLEEYLKLQKLRFGNTFDYRINVEKTVEKWLIHKLIIQPFVENSILHGFKGFTYGRLLTIDFSAYGEDRMRVTLRDNGVGIPPEKYRYLQESVKIWGTTGAVEGIGLENAFQRIRFHYGKSARIYLRSWVGVGTTVVLILPRYQAEDQA